MPLLGGKSNKFKVDPPKIRIEKVIVERPTPPTPKARPKPRSRCSAAAASVSSSSSPATSRPSPRLPSVRHDSNSPHPPSSDERRLARKRKAAGAAASRPSPASDRVAFDKDSDNEDDGWMSLDSRKRQRQGTADGRFVDPNRKLRNSRAFEGRNQHLQFVHAVHVASLEAKCVPVMGAQKEDVAIELQYPSLQPREK